MYGGATSTTDIAKPGTMFVTGSPAWSDYDFSVRAYSKDNDALGVIFRYVDKNNYYRFSMDRERKYRRLVVKKNGVYRTLTQTTTYGYASSVTNTIRIVAVGPSITVLVNNVRVLSAKDASLSSGRFGLYTWANPTTFGAFSASVAARDYFSIAVLPDTQNEMVYAPAAAFAQTTWIAANRARQNIAMVLHEGDVVNNLSSSAQWANATAALAYLGGKVPYAVAAGNHDIQARGAMYPKPVITRPFNDFTSGLVGYRVDGRFARDDNRNTFTLLSAGGVDMVVINLSFGARDDALLWAGKIADTYPHRHVIMLTHDYLGQDNAVRGLPGDHDLPRDQNPTLNNPIDIWNKFVRIHPNVQFTFNGHVIEPTPPGLPYSIGRLVSQNDQGRNVYQTLTNFQTYGSGPGYMRVFRFYPSSSRVDVQTFSPYLHTFLTDGENQFSYADVNLTPFTSSTSA